MRTREIALTSLFATMVLALQLVAMPALHLLGAEVEIEIPDALALLAVVTLGWKPGVVMMSSLWLQTRAEISLGQTRGR